MTRVFSYIPARSGSKRIPGKNMLPLLGHPLIAYTIECAINTGVFADVFVSTDSIEIARVSREYGASCNSLRPSDISGSNSPDIDWLIYELENHKHVDDDIIVIMRPTNPMRESFTILDALEIFSSHPEVDSLRAMRPVREHPSKMWRLINNSNEVEPFDIKFNETTQTHNHSSPTQLLEPMLIQDASLEITTVRSVRKNLSLTGARTISFQMPEYQGFDINYPEDLDYLMYLIKNKIVSLPNLPMRRI